MKLRLWYNLRRIKNDLDPRAGFKRELALKLSKRFDAVHGKKTVWYLQIWVRTTRVILASTVGVSMVSTSVYAYSSPSVTEDSVLYPVKIGIEKIEEETKTTAESKAKFLLKKVERREAERSKVVERVGSEVRLTFTAITGNVTSTPTSTEPETIVITVKPGEVSRIEKQIEEVEHDLQKIETELGDSEQTRSLRKKIDERLGRHKAEDEVAIVPGSVSSTAFATGTLATTSTITEFDRDENDDKPKSFIRGNKVLSKILKKKNTQKIKIIKNEKGEIKVVDNKNEYNVYSTSSAMRLEQIVASSTPVRLEINERDRTVRKYRSESKTDERSDEVRKEEEKRSEENKKREENKETDQSGREDD